MNDNTRGDEDRQLGVSGLSHVCLVLISNLLRIVIEITHIIYFLTERRHLP